ncbi:MAG: response regulator [Pirellulales bacterium]|nr:response regulator [Pirellulales bacterium]
MDRQTRKTQTSSVADLGSHIERRILIVDDSEINRDLLECLFHNDYSLDLAVSGEECLKKLPVFCPDLVLLDIILPGIDGYETCRRIKSCPMGDFTQVIIISSKSSPAERLEGYEAGAEDYIVKPFEHDELMAKVRSRFKLRDSLANLWAANARIQEFNSDLEELVVKRTSEIIDTRDVAVFALANSRDPETGEHLERIRDYSQILAEHLGRSGPYARQIDRQFLEDLYRSSPLHDIGKVGIPDAILQKPGSLTKEEYEIMTSHAVIGAEALKEAAGRSDSGGFLNMAIDIARYHHEHFNGCGYPDGLVGSDIPLSARIVALPDVYDALTSGRVYKEAFSPEIAKAMIVEQRGAQFDPVVVDAFLKRYDDFLAIGSSSGKTLSPVTVQG